MYQQAPFSSDCRCPTWKAPTARLTNGQNSVLSHDGRSGTRDLRLLLRSPAISLGVTILGEICACVTVSNPTIEAVTFRLRGWGVPGVFFSPAFTRLGHECQDLWSPWDGMHVCTDYTSVYTLIRKSFGGMGSLPMLTPGEKKIPSTGQTHDAASRKKSEPNTLPTSYFGPSARDEKR